MTPTHCDLIFKILVLGDAGVGKSSIIKQYVDREFVDSYITTIGIDYSSKYINVDGKSVKLAIWDTAGQERFRSITKSYLRGIQGVLLVYDVCDSTTFRNITHWLSMVHEYADEEHIKYFLIGNKNDLIHKRQVSYEQGNALAAQHNCKFVECNALEYNKVARVFQSITSDLIKDVLNFRSKEIICELQENNKKENRCCF